MIAEEECHQLLDTLKLTYPIAERFKIDGDKSTIAESLQLLAKLVKTYVA